MKLRVIQEFNGLVEGKLLKPGDVIHSTDVERINKIIKGGFGEIISLEDAPDEDKEELVEFQGVEYGLSVLKEALGSIGASVAPNAGVKGVTNAIAKLSEEKATELANALKKE